MKQRSIRQLALAMALGALLVGLGAGSTLAQDGLGANVTIGSGGISAVGDGVTTILAPGVTISGGDVSNSTGIDVLSGGGSSIGATTGGSDSAAVVE